MSCMPSLSPSTNDFLSQLERQEKGYSSQESSQLLHDFELSMDESLQEFEMIYEEVSTPVGTPSSDEKKTIT